MSLLAPSAVQQPDTSPAAIADDFLAALQERHQRSALENAAPSNAESHEHEAPPLRYFQADFFEHRRNFFRRVSPEQLRARVVEHMRLTMPRYTRSNVCCTDSPWDSLIKRT